MKANPRPHGKKPLSCLPFDAYRAIINHYGGETVGIAKIAEDTRHWIKRPGGLLWQDDYEYKVLKKSEFDTFSAIGIPVLPVNYKPIRKWLAATRLKNWPMYSQLTAWIVFCLYMAAGEFIEGFDSSTVVFVILWMVAVLASAFVFVCAWAGDN